MQRKLAALLLGGAGLLVLPVAPAAGQTAGSSAPANPAGALTAAPAPGSSVDGASSGFALAIEPGQSAEQTLNVTNGTTDRRLAIRVVSVDGMRGNDGVTYADSATAQGSGTFVAPTVGVVVVEPGASIAVPFTVEVPRDVAAGDAFVAGVRVFAESATDLAGAPVAFDDVPTLTVPVAIAVPGAPTPLLAVTKVVAAEKDGATHLAVTVRNSGSIVTDAEGTVKAPGGELERELRVRVEPREEVTTLVEWQTIDVVRGADVAVELVYGDGDIATWVGVVAANPEPNATGPVPEATTASTATPTATGTTAGPGRGNLAGTILGLLILALMIAAAVWFLLELFRNRRPISVPIDPAAFPTLQVMMDPRHTDVLGALVTQVGALGGAIEHLADKIGVTVAIPTPLEPLSGTGRGHRPHASSRPRHAPNPEAPPPQPQPQEMAAATSSAFGSRPTHDDLSVQSREEIAGEINDAVAAARGTTTRTPVFIPPPMPDNWLDDEWTGREAAPPPLISPPPVVGPSGPAGSEPDNWPGPTPEALEAFFERRAGEDPDPFWSNDSPDGA